MVERSEMFDVLRQHGLVGLSFAVIGPDKLPEFSDWRVMITADDGPRYLDLAAASRLESDVRRIGELGLAERLASAIATATRMMRPQVAR